jgi:hypothetical protein
MKDETAVHDELSVAMRREPAWAKVVDLMLEVCQDQHSLIKPMLSVLACGQSSLPDGFKPTKDQRKIGRELSERVNAMLGPRLNSELAGDGRSASPLDERPCPSDAPAAPPSSQSPVVKALLFRPVIEFTLNGMADGLRKTSGAPRESFEVLLWSFVPLLQRAMNLGMMVPPSRGNVMRLAQYLEVRRSDVPDLLPAVERRRVLWSRAITGEPDPSFAGRRDRSAPAPDFSWEDLECLMSALCRTKPTLIEAALMILGCVRPPVSALYEVGLEDQALVEQLGELLESVSPMPDFAQLRPEAATERVSSSFALLVSLAMGRPHFRFALRQLIVIHECMGPETLLPLLEEEPVDELLPFLADGLPGLWPAFLKTLRSGPETADMVARWTAPTMATVEDL